MTICPIKLLIALIMALLGLLNVGCMDYYMYKIATDPQIQSKIEKMEVSGEMVNPKVTVFYGGAVSVQVDGVSGKSLISGSAENDGIKPEPVESGKPSTGSVPQN